MIGLIAPDQRSCSIRKLGETCRVLQDDIAPKQRLSSITRDQSLELAQKIEVNGSLAFSLATAPAKSHTKLPWLIAADVDLMAIEKR